MLKFPPPLVGTIAIFQAGVIVASCLVTSTFYKLYEVHLAQASVLPRQLPWALSFMLEYGAFLLLIPLFWGCAATLWADTEGRVPMVTRRQSYIGIGLACLLLIFGAMSSLMSCQLLVRPLLYSALGSPTQ